jgi:hypothetical protein
MVSTQELKKSDWELIYEIGGKIHERLFEMWGSAAAIYAKDADTMKVDFSINEGGKRVRYPVELSLEELRSLDGDWSAIADEIIATFQERLK